MRFIFIAALLSSTAAFACPNLTGKYATCRSMTGQSEQTSDMEITQSENNGVTTYIITSTDDSNQQRSTDTTVADGSITTTQETDAETGIVISMTAQATCTDDALNYDITATAAEVQFAKMNVKMKKNGNQLVQEITGEAMGQTLSDTVICE